MSKALEGHRTGLGRTYRKRCDCHMQARAPGAELQGQTGIAVMSLW